MRFNLVLLHKILFVTYTHKIQRDTLINNLIAVNLTSFLRKMRTLYSRKKRIKSVEPTFSNPVFRNMVMSCPL